MEEYSREYRLGSIEAKLDLLVHHLNQRSKNYSNMEQGVFVECGFWYQEDLVYANYPSTYALSREFKTHISG